MSALNGDKARFQRLRKAGLRRREQSRLALAGMRLAATRRQQGSAEAGSDAERGQIGGMRLIRGGLVTE